MSQGEATIRLDADVSAYINKVVRAQKATEDAGKGLGKSLKETESVTGKILDGFTAWAAKVLTISTAIQSLAAGLNAVNDFQRKMGEGNIAAGAKELQRSQAIQNLGLTGKAAMGANAWGTQGNKAATADQRLAFLTALGQYNQGLAPGLQLKPEQIQQMQALFAAGGEGVYGTGGQGLIAGAGKYGGAPMVGIQQYLNRKLGREGTGGDAMSMTQQLLGSMSREAQDEIVMRQREGRIERRVDSFNLSAGSQQQRMFNKATDAARRTSPEFAASEAMLLGLGPYAEGAARANAAESEAQTGKYAGGMDRAVKVLTEIRDQGKQATPNVKTRSEESTP